LPLSSIAIATTTTLELVLICQVVVVGRTHKLWQLLNFNLDFTSINYQAAAIGGVRIYGNFDI
jgi:hypothetical protein